MQVLTRLHLIDFAVFFFVLTRTSAAVNYRWTHRKNFKTSNGSVTAKKNISIFFLLFFFLCYYMILDTCLLIILTIICCLFIDMVENAGDDPRDRKPSDVDSIKG